MNKIHQSKRRLFPIILCLFAIAAVESPPHIQWILRVLDGTPNQRIQIGLRSDGMVVWRTLSTNVVVITNSPSEMTTF